MTFFIPEELVAQQKLGEDSTIIRFIRLLDWIKQLLSRMKAVMLHQ